MNLDASVCAGNRSSTDTPVEEMGSVVNLAAEMAANKRLYSLKMDDGGGGDVHMNMNSVGCKADTNANSTTDGPPPPLHCHSQSHSSFLAMGMGGYEEVAIQTESVDNCEPCETGSHLLLEGVVWHETQDGKQSSSPLPFHPTNSLPQTVRNHSRIAERTKKFLLGSLAKQNLTKKIIRRKIWTTFVRTIKRTFFCNLASKNLIESKHFLCEKVLISWNYKAI